MPEDQGARTQTSLKDAARLFVREAIAAGRYPPGSKVDQDEVASALEASRIPVREALIELEQKGFVELIPRRGAFVTSLEIEDIADHFAALGLLVAMASRRAAEVMDESTLTELQQIDREIDALGPGAGADSPAGVLNLRFLRVINQAGSSRFLRSTLRFLSGSLPGVYYTQSSRWAEAESRYRQNVLNALTNKDGDEAARVANAHLSVCETLTIDVLEARNYWGLDGGRG
jgi:DNA-binding GntR family transcriptional regulator